MGSISWCGFRVVVLVFMVLVLVSVGKAHRSTPRRMPVSVRDTSPWRDLKRPEVRLGWTGERTTIRSSSQADARAASSGVSLVPGAHDTHGAPDVTLTRTAGGPDHIHSLVEFPRELI